MSYSIEFSRTAQEDLEFWKKSGLKPFQNKIKTLLQSIQQNPFNGIGKPEPLKHDLSGYWSRRINKEHRIVYKVDKSTIYVIALRFHYK